MQEEYKVIETERLIFKPFSALTSEQKQELGKSWANPFNARFNGQKNPYSTVEELFQMQEPTFKDLENYDDYMYFRAIFNKKGELIGNCRMGVYHTTKKLTTWDFGFNILIKHWSKGYGVEILQAICEFAKLQGAKYVIGGASNDNFGSYHAMIKNGFKYNGIDNDGDFSFILDLTAPKPSKKEIEDEWQAQIDRYLTRPNEDDATFGQDKFNRLNEINQLIKEMVKRIQAGEDEDKLVEEYYSICNAIEEFPEKSIGF